METVLPIVQSIFFNISLYFSIKRCQRNENYVKPTSSDESTEDENRNRIYGLVVGTEPVQNRTIWQSFFGMFSPYEEEMENVQIVSEKLKVDTTSPYICDTVILATQQESVYAEMLIQWLIVFLLMFIIFFVSCIVLFCAWKKQLNRVSILTKKKPKIAKFDKMGDKIEEVNSCSEILETDADKGFKPFESEQTIPKSTKTAPVKLTSGKFNTTSDLFKGSKTDYFLEQTVENFLCELDKKLSTGMSQDENPNFLTSALASNMTASISTPTASLTTPRVVRRPASAHIRRARQTITSYPIGSGNLFDNNPSRLTPWHELEVMRLKINWSYRTYLLKQPDLNEVTDPRLRNVLQYYLSSCPIRLEQLSCATFIVNYILLLLEKELNVLVSEDGFRFLGFKVIGSMSKGTKINKASQFDFLMLLNCSKCSLDLGYHHSICEDIPPGKILLTAHENKPNIRLKKILKRAYVDDSFHQVLAPSDVMANVYELTNRALSNIMSRNKKIMDRIPFTVGRSSDPELSIVLNTRLLHGLGFGIPEILIRLKPAIPLQHENSLMLPRLYAVVPQHLQDVHSKPNTIPSQGLRIFRQPESLDKDLLWSLSYCDLESYYINDFLSKIEETGVQSCFHVCLQVLKSLFSNSSRTSLLNRGEIESYYIETILYFLLLESTPSNWTFDKLPCRLSDAIHFLKSAVQSQWLPNFFVANPHLMKKSPVLQHIPFLNCSRQMNLFSHMSADVSRKTLFFINSRLTETGISAALKKDYSSEMWEYEFFVFG